MHVDVTRALHKTALLGIGALILGLLLVGCGGSSSTAATPTDTPTATPTDTPTATTGGSQASVRITGSLASGFTFSPNTITVKVGTTVAWTNGTGTPHTVTSDAGSAVTWDSQMLNPGATFTFMFTQAGTFHYHCNFHPNMHGTVTVTS